MKRSGILAAGNWIIDHVKIIDSWPQQDALANILAESKGNGGSPYNVLKNLSKLGADFPLMGAGLLGDDANGKDILADCTNHGIDTTHLMVKEGGTSSYTDVMTVASTGRRTFFHARGTNDDFAPEHLSLQNTPAKIFHLGYMMLLKKMDEQDDKGRTGASYVFEQAQQLGIKTSADLVSENSDRFKKIVTPSLPYIDYLFLNEFEAEKLTGISLGNNQSIDVRAAEQALRIILNHGVREWVFLHFSYGCVAMHATGTIIKQPALKIPANLIKGTTGAGDAFAAGALLAIHQGADIQQTLLTAVSTAASSLFEPECSSAIKPLQETLKLSQKFGFYA